MTAITIKFIQLCTLRNLMLILHNMKFIIVDNYI